MDSLDLFADAREARDEAMERAAAHADQHWRAGALDAIRALATREATIHPDDAREAIAERCGEPREWRVLGPLLLAAAREGWIERSGVKRQSTRATNHAHERECWRSLLYQPNPWEETGRERKATALARAFWRLERDIPGKRPATPLSERVAGLRPAAWEALARVTDTRPASDATVTRVVELIREAEARDRRMSA